MTAVRVRRVVWAWIVICAAACAASPGVAATLLAETPLFRAIGAAEGLPSERVYALAQDRAGYLWIGTGDGLARFDGVDLQVYNHEPQQPASLPSNVVQALHVDAEDRLWIGSEGGGLGMLGRDRRVLQRHRLGPPHGLPLDDVWAIASTPDGAIWCGGYGGGLYRLARDGSVRGFRHAANDPHSLGSDHVLALEVDRAGTLWIGTAAGLDQWNGERFERQPLRDDGLQPGSVSSLHADEVGALWIGTAAGLVQREADGRWRRHALPAAGGSRAVRSLLRDRGGSLWAGRAHGLSAITARGRLREFDGRARQRYGTGPHAILDLLQDHEGGLWFASEGNGLLRLAPGWRDYAVWLVGEHAPRGLHMSLPQAVAQGRGGTLWVAGPGGIVDRIDTRSGDVGAVLDGDAGWPERNLLALLETPDGALWIGRGAGLSRYAPDTGALQHWSADSATDPVLRGAVDLLVADGAGGLWLSVHGAGIEHRDARGHLLERYAAEHGDGPRLADSDQLALGPDGALWIAGADGVARHDAVRGTIEHVPGGPGDRVFGLAFDGAGRLWAQRLGALEQYRWDGRRLHRLRRVGAAQGMPAIEAGGVLATADGEIWLSSTRGLLRYQPDPDSVRRYAVRDGLPGQEFRNRPPLLDAAGRIVALTDEAVVMVDPRRLRAAPAAPPLRVQRISVRRQHAEHVLDAALPLQLAHDDRELKIAVRLLSFAEPLSHRYRFRIDGIDADWVYTGAHGERTLGTLPPGRHRVRIAAQAAGSAWTAPVELVFDVATPWWDTTAARSAAAMSIACLVLLGWQLQRRWLAQRHARELAERQRQWTERASDAKTRFLATLGHEIRTPMTGVLGMTELLLESALDPQQRHRAVAIQRSGELMLRLVNDALDLARIEAGQLRLEPRVFDLVRLVRDCADAVQPLAERKQLRIDVMVAAGTPQWVFGDPDRVRQILLNLGSNAVKFTDTGHVDFMLADIDGGVQIAVVDSGPGLTAAQQQRLFRRFSQADGEITARRYGGSGLGLAISRELVQAMGGEIDLDSMPGEGSRFCVRLPLPAAIAPAMLPTMPPPIAASDLLLVEDDPIAAETIAGLLRLRGHGVRHAADGLAALSELAVARPALALLDLDLPGLDGCALAVMLRAREPQLPLVALTARADPAAEPQARAAGFAAFLRKPAVGDVLAATVADVLGEARP